MQRRNLPLIPREQAQRVLQNFELFHRHCHPRVLSSYLRLVFNGWTTDRRMRSLRSAYGGKGACLLGCPAGEDSIEHYAHCAVFWAFASSSRPRGLGFRLGALSKKLYFFGIADGMHEADKVRLALGVYAVFRSTNSLRHNGSGAASFNFTRYLAMWANFGARGSAAQRFLRRP